jgi:hypothetical protein
MELARVRMIVHLTAAPHLNSISFAAAPELRL